MPSPADAATPWALPTPFGPDLLLRVDADDHLVTAAFRPDAAAAHPPPPARLRDPLQAYLEDPARGLPDLPVRLDQGTPFQQAVWEALRAIPAGGTRTYGEVAAAAGSPRGARAAGQAVGANPVPVVVPCHRVVPSDGSLGGYGAGPGPPLKRRLLEAESAWPP